MREGRMAGGQEPLPVQARPISGGSTREAELPGAAWPARVERSETPLVQGLRRFRRSTTALVGVAIVLVIVLVALFADVLAPRSPIASDQMHTFERPSWDYPLGTDQLGRDMLSRIIHGTRISLLVGVSSVLLALFVGVPFGMIAGFYGGRVDSLVMRVMDLILAFPIYLLAIILMVIFTPTAGLIGTMKVTGAIAIVRIPIYARLVRGSAISIIVEATLSFLGLGTQPPTPSWGWDLKANIAFIQANAWLSLFPGLAIFVTVLGFNLFGDGLRDALDPRLK